MPRNPHCPPARKWCQTLTQYIADHPDRPLKARALARELSISSDSYHEFRDLVRQMLSDGTLVLGPGRTLVLPERAGKLVGVFQAHPRRFGFIERAGKPDAYVPRGKTHGARDGDTVAARLLPRGRRHTGPRAEVTRILERAPLRWVGVLEQLGQDWVVRPQGAKSTPLVRIEDPTAKSARPGDFVVIEPLEHTLSARSPQGVIIEKLGPHGDTQIKILAVIRRHGIPDRFPPEVRRAAQRAAGHLDSKAIAAREDLRGLLTLTIDPVDARDFDDAISIEPLAGGKTRLGVHIADVAHFVKPDGPLDREARLRGNSVYFPGFVVPMLPEVLSNGVCSLQPGEPRLTKSVFLTYDRQARVTETRFANSVIRSHVRLTYEQVTAALAGRKAGLDRQTIALLKHAERLARRIRDARLADGMIVLTLPEVEIRLNEQGRVVDAGPADTSFSHTIIEMFMVAANEAVCRLLVAEGIPHLRRIHPEPEPREALRSAQLLAGLGYRVPRGLDREGIQALLDRVRGKPEEMVVNYLLLRALPQAAYSPTHQGHFALASDDYCHFTSPIRRYPDLVSHRLLDAYLHHGPARSRRRRAADIESQLDLDELGRHTSSTERRAEQAERDAKKLLLLELMKSKLGETLTGIITGVTSFGVFVQVRPYLAEGLVRVGDFGPDVWRFDKTNGLFVGRGGRRVVRLGQQLEVVVAAVDEFREELVLGPADGGPIGTPRR
jgi:ribonuclease R